MRTALVFVTGLAIGSAISTGFAQSARLTGVNNMNHVAIVVENFSGAIGIVPELGDPPNVRVTIESLEELATQHAA